MTPGKVINYYFFVHSQQLSK